MDWELLNVKLSFFQLSLRLRLKIVLKVHCVLLVLIINLSINGWKRLLIPSFPGYPYLAFLVLLQHHNLFDGLLWNHLFASKFLKGLGFLLRQILLVLGLHRFVRLISVYCWKLLHVELMNCNWLWIIHLQIHNRHRTGFFILNPADMWHLFSLAWRAFNST